MPPESANEKQVARACWWCGVGGPLTREHVVPSWMAKVLHGEGTMEHSYAEPGEVEPARTWSKVSPDFKARVVCETCNSGWMEALETACRRRVGGMVAGVPRSLSRVDCQVLGRWAAKTGYLFQALEPAGHRVVSMELYEPLWRSAVLPSTVRVWAGGVQAQGVFAHAFGGTLQQKGHTAQMFTLLMTFDRLAFMAIGSPDPDLLRLLELGHRSKAWVEIGDVEHGVRWPAPFTFDTENFMAMPSLMAELAGIPRRARVLSA